MIARRILRYWLVLFLASLLMACAAGSTAEPAATAPVDTAPVTLVLWHGWDGMPRAVLGRLVERFNQQYAGGRILAQSMPLTSMVSDFRVAGQAGSGPHMLLIPHSWLGTLRPDLLPLNDTLGAQEDALLPVTVASATVRADDGTSHLYGFPVSFDTTALFYNRDNLLQAPATTDQLLQVARGLSDPQAVPPRWGLAANLSYDLFAPYLYAFGGQLFNADGQVVLGSTGRDGAERWLAWLQGISADDRLLVQPDSSIAVDRALGAGNVLTTVGWSYQFSFYQRVWGQRMGVAPLPALVETGNPAVSFVQTEVLAINGRVNDREEATALAFAAFLLGEEAQTALRDSGLQPARADVPLAGDTPELLAAQVFRQQAQHGQPLPNIPQRDSIRQEVDLMIRRVLVEGVAPTDAVSETDRRLRQLLGQ